MFIKTVKIRSFWAAVTLLAIVAVAAAAIVFAVQYAHNKTARYHMTNEVQRQEFIGSLGWEVSEEYDTCRIVIIPESFDEVYTNYNEIQKQQGFDLEEYKGRTVEIYSYPVYNYEGEENVMMNLMICDGTLIGGDVCCTELDGFMHGLKKPDGEADSNSSEKPSEDDNTDDTENADDSTAEDMSGEEEPAEENDSSQIDNDKTDW